MSNKPTIVEADGLQPNLSMNVSVDRQTPKTDFGAYVNGALNSAGTIMSHGAALMGGSMPGAGIVSAAVSSVTGLSNMPGSTSASASYAATGVVNLGNNGGGMSTTVGGAGGAVTTSTSVGTPNLNAGASNNNIGMMNNEISLMAAENQKMLATQINLQRENQVFTSVSNVLKTKHDTVKNSISNIR